MQNVGSGSPEADGPFQIVAMKEKSQTRIMHEGRFRERERFAHKTTKTLSQRSIPALHMSGFPCFLADCCMLLFRNDSLLGLPKIGGAMASARGFWKRSPQFLTGLLTSISYSVSHDLSWLAAESNPAPRLIRLLEHKGPCFI